MCILFKVLSRSGDGLTSVLVKFPPGLTRFSSFKANSQHNTLTTDFQPCSPLFPTHWKAWSHRQGFRLVFLAVP